MFLGHIANFEKELQFISAVIIDGLQYIRNTDFSDMLGRYEITDKMYVNIEEYVTFEKTARNPEAHEKHIDIQFIISGEERIGVSRRTAQNEILQDCLAEKDFILYKNAVNETDLILTEGMYAVFFPWDIHRPCCRVNEACQVKKAVVKISMG